MKKNICFLFLITLFISGYAQNESKIVSIDGIDLDLADVDVDKGWLIESTRGWQLSPKTNDSIYMESELTVFKSPSNSHFLVIEEWSKDYGNYSFGFESSISYYDSMGQLLFEKEYQMTAGQILITNAGKYIYLELGSETKDIHIILDKDGNTVKSIDGQFFSNILFQEKHITNIIKYNDCDTSSQCLVTVLSDSDNYCKDIMFARKNLKIHSISKDEEFFALSFNDSLLVYNKNGEFQWKIDRPSKYNGIVFMNNHNKYLFCNSISDPIISIKDWNNHGTISEIRAETYKSIKIGLYEMGFPRNSSNDFYVASRSGNNYIFIFFTENGEIINSTESSLKRVSEYKFFYTNGEYTIE